MTNVRIPLLICGFKAWFNKMHFENAFHFIIIQFANPKSMWTVLMPNERSLFCSDFSNRKSNVCLHSSNGHHHCIRLFACLWAHFRQSKYKTITNAATVVPLKNWAKFAYEYSISSHNLTIQIQPVYIHDAIQTNDWKLLTSFDADVINVLICGACCCCFCSLPLRNSR